MSLHIFLKKTIYQLLVNLLGEKTKDYNVRFNSSVSNSIICTWAYTFSLLDTSIKFNGDHPNLIMTDNPKQQDAAIENFHSFLNEYLYIVKRKD